MDTEGFFEALCERRLSIMSVFALALVLFTIQVPYLLVVEPGSSLYVVATLNVAGSGVFMLIAGAILLKCRSMQAS